MNDDFEKMVREALLDLPPHIREKIENTAICIEEEATEEQLRRVGVKHKMSLFGLYEGVPKNVWGRGFGNYLPDKITLFRKPIEQAAPEPRKLKYFVRKVVWHEIAHHFGFNEKGAKAIEKK